MAVWQVRRQIVPASRSSSTEGSVAEVGARPTDEKHNECQLSAVFLGERRWRGSTAVVQRHPQRRKMCHRNPPGREIRKLGDEIYLIYKSVDGYV